MLSYISGNKIELIFYLKNNSLQKENSDADLNIIDSK